MSRVTPRPFQTTATQSGVQIFSECKRLLDVAGNDTTEQAAAINHHGTLLLEAPTGAGKTLIAGHLAEIFSATEQVVWLWFAPFRGVTSQTSAALRAELPGLRLRELAEDRQIVGSKTGDVFVTTWQTVAARLKDRRNVHKPGEQNPTVEELIVGLRNMGLRIGVVIDEAHHGFFGAGAETQAMRFFREQLHPEYTLLVTATPDDADIARFQKAVGLTRLNRITISRQEPIEEGLIKPGIKCVAYFAPEGQQSLVDFEDTALRDGVALHRRLKVELKNLGVALTPLLLVQVDSKDKSVDQAKERLLALGFTDSQIAIHTAEEPDSSLLALANDESREVLVFKMAVALGFDAPRAFALVSMRAARDEDFGVQLVGRILRVHRRLQARARAKTIPEALRFGYVFLADAEGQTGLDLAGQRINRLLTEYAKVSSTTAIVQIGGQMHVQVLGPGGQTQLFPLSPILPADGIGQDAGMPPAVSDGGVFALDLLTGNFTLPDLPAGATAASIALQGKINEALSLRGYNYPLRADVPKRFKTQVVSPDNAATEDDCANKFILSSKDLLNALAAKIQVKRQTLEVFTHQLEIEFTSASMDPRQTAIKALKVLTNNQTFDPRELRRALLRKLKTMLRDLGMAEADDDTKVNHMLNVILTAHPELLYVAQKKALAANCEIEESEEGLPANIASDNLLPTSRFNIYQVVPPGLNTWELSFAELLDRDTENIVRWWHRNLPHKPWSVQVVLDNGRGFFPDFIIGINGRQCEDGALLADPKFGFEIAQEQPKSYAEHPAYGRVLILNLQGDSRWMTVRFDAKIRKAVIDTDFELAKASSY